MINRVATIAMGLSVAVLMTGCLGGDIDTVKDGVLKFDKTLTVGEALDNWKICEDTSWEQYETDNGREVVEFTCVQKNIVKSMKTKIDIIMKPKTATELSNEIEQIITDYKNKYQNSVDKYGSAAKSYLQTDCFVNIEKLRQYDIVKVEVFLELYKNYIDDECRNLVPMSSSLTKPIVDAIDYNNKVKNSQTKMLDVETIKNIFQFTINKDDTFQLVAAENHIIWKDGKDYDTNLKHNNMLRRAYNNKNFDIYELFGMQSRELLYVSSIIADKYLTTLTDTQRKNYKTTKHKEIVAVYEKMKNEFSEERKTRNDKLMQDTIEPDIDIKDDTTDTKKPKTPKNDSTYFGVVGVKPNDVLNMRAEPNYKTALVVKIPHDGKCLEEIQVDINSIKTGWMKVQYKNSIGWVSTKFLELDTRCP